MKTRTCYTPCLVGLGAGGEGLEGGRFYKPFHISLLLETVVLFTSVDLSLSL